MNLSELYRNFLNELKKIYSEHEAANITSMIFESIGITRAALIKEPNQLSDEGMILTINNSLSALRSHKPVQYILGEAWFYKMKLKVTPAVLIPRPETEELAEAVIDFLRHKPGAGLLDVGTGSGCIAIAVKKNLPAIFVTAIDVSEDALSVARANATLHHTEIKFLSLDFLEEKSWEVFEQYDVIVSNPPYIPLNELKNIDKNVAKYEPHLALFVATSNPLVFYEKIALFGKKYLKKEGKIFMETHENFGDSVCELFSNHHYEASIKKDMFEKQRMVIATRSR